MRQNNPSWRILIIGAGVIGSIYGARLASAGHQVTMLARGGRLAQVREHGLVLRHTLTWEEIRTPVAVTDEIPEDGDFDLVIVAVRRDQAASVLPLLAEHRGRFDVMFMVNNLSGYAEWERAVGPGRLMIGFPGAGGALKDWETEYVIVSWLLQPTTVGEPDGRVSSRIRLVAAVLSRAGFPAAVCRNMDAWQKYHAAWVTPCSFAIYRAMGKGVELWQDRRLVDTMLTGIREGFRVLKSMGFPVTPAKLRMLENTPKILLNRGFRLWAASDHFETVALRHSLNARSEMGLLAREFMALAGESGLDTPALKTLYGI